MGVLVDVPQFRSWAGAAVSTVPDDLIAGCIDEAEAGLGADLALVDFTTITTNPAALPLAEGETLRRASRLLARRNSPEAIAGFGEAAITIPVRDPDSYRTIRALFTVLNLHEGIS